MKNMLISLKQTLYSDFLTAVSFLASVVHQQDKCILHVENKVSDLLIAHYDMIDTCTEHEDELQIINLKLADLEDRSRWNNIKFCNIPESVQQSEIVHFLQSLLHTPVPELTDRDLEIDRSHRLPKPSQIPAKNLGMY